MLVPLLPSSSTIFSPSVPQLKLVFATRISSTSLLRTAPPPTRMGLSRVPRVGEGGGGEEEREVGVGGGGSWVVWEVEFVVVEGVSVVSDCCVCTGG